MLVVSVSGTNVLYIVIQFLISKFKTYNMEMFVSCLIPWHMSHDNLFTHIESFARNVHIGFDIDYESHKNMRLVSNKAPDDRIV